MSPLGVSRKSTKGEMIEVEHKELLGTVLGKLSHLLSAAIGAAGWFDITARAGRRRTS